MTKILCWLFGHKFTSFGMVCRRCKFIRFQMKDCPPEYLAIVNKDPWSLL